MPAMHPDLEPFYGSSSPFAVDLVRQGDVEPFRGVLSEADQEAFQGYIVGTVVEIRWPTGTATLREGDSVAELDAAGAIARSFRVARDGRRVLDGRESLAYLTEQP